MRKSVNGLSLLVEEYFELDQFSGSLFAIYSLIETAKANKLDLYRYLRFLFETLPLAQSEEEYRKLLPTALSEETMPRFLG